MNYIEELNIDLNKRQIITVTGSGGKTTIIEEMSKALVEEGKNILIATSTKIFYPDNANEITVLNDEILKNIRFLKPSIIYGGREISSDNKIVGYDTDIISSIFENKNIDFILVEGDGSNRKPVKGYSDFEPVVPEETDILISVLGMNSLATVVNEENVHRVERFMDITGLGKGDVIECDDLLRLFVHENGYFKKKCKRNFIVLNRVNEINRKCAEYIMDTAEYEIDFIEKALIREDII